MDKSSVEVVICEGTSDFIRYIRSFQVVYEEPKQNTTIKFECNPIKTIELVNGTAVLPLINELVAKTVTTETPNVILFMTPFFLNIKTNL